MFSIYGVSGQVFSGTLEQLNRVHALARARAARAVAVEGQELGVAAGEPAAEPSRHDAVRAYSAMLPPELERGPLYHADQIMQRRVISVAADAEVGLAWRILRDNAIRQAPVLDDVGQLVGIVSERDLLTAINIDDGRVVDVLARRVADLMSTPVVSAAPLTDLRRIADVMLSHGVDGVPITSDRGRLLGFVSRSDILRAVVVDPPLSLWR